MKIFGWEIRASKEIEKEKNEINEKINKIEKKLDKIEDTLKDILSRINMNEYDIKRIAERTNTTEENVKDIMISMQDKLSIIDDYNEALDLILEHIDKKNPNMNVQKPIYHGPVIDEDNKFIVKSIKGTQERYNELASLNIWKSYKQLDWLFLIEWKTNAPIFKGKTQAEIRDYITNYEPLYIEWKQQHNNIYVSTEIFRNNYFNSNKGVAYSYGN